MRFNPRKSRTQRFAERILVALLFLALSGAVYEQVGAWKDRRRFPQIGHSVDIGGRSLNVYCSGEGNPAVVLSSGGGVPRFNLGLVQPQIAPGAPAFLDVPARRGWGDPRPAHPPRYFLWGGA